MPTHKDETLPQRYAREHQDYIKLCGSMTAEQVADLQLQLNNALAREQAMQQRLTAADEPVDAAIAFVTRMIECAGGQPSIATGYLNDILDTLKPAVGSTQPTCTWSHDEIGIWAGSCGTKWAFTDDGPTENGMRFCHSCGKTLVVMGKPA